MKLFKIWQTVNNTYDTFDSVIVAAESEEQARRILPQGGFLDVRQPNSHFGAWVNKIEDVNVEYIGEAKEGTVVGVILASFNAG